MTKTACTLATWLLAAGVAGAQSYGADTFARGMQELPDGAHVVWDGASAPADAEQLELSLPFRFPGFGGHDRARVHADGAVSLGTRGRIELFAADLEVRDQGRVDQVRVGLVGTAPRRAWVVEFDSVSPKGDTSAYLYGQIQLHEDGQVELHYGSTQRWNGLRAQIGIVLDGQRVGPGESELPAANLRFTPSSGPDLALRRVRVEGDRARVTVANPGLSSSDGGEVVLYLSRNETISTQDRRVGAANVPTLAAGAERELSFGLDLQAAPEGSWYVGARLSPRGSDANANNHVAYDARPLWTGQGNDLRVPGVVARQHEVLAGVEVEVEVELENLGQPSPEFEYAVYLSVNDRITSGDRELARGRVAAGLSGRTQRSLRVGLPSDVAPGTYVLGVAVDPAGSVREVDESNQTGRDPLALRVSSAAPPDLEPRALELDVRSAGVGDEVWITRTLENTGLARAGDFKYSVLLSRDTRPSADDARLLEGSVSGLDAQAASGPRRVPAQVPALAEGTYRVLLVVDPEDRIAEEREDNNVLVAAATLEVRSAGLPDLRATAVSSRYRTARVGGRLVLSRELQNRGSGESGACDYAIYLSTNQSVTTSDRELHRFRFSDGLAPGERHSETVELDVPSSVAPGDYWVGLIVDPDDAVQESEERNNTAASAVFVRIDRGQKVVRVAPRSVYANDGDTIRVSGQTYRFIGADTPEKSSRTFDGNQEPQASRASDFTRAQLRNASEVAIHHNDDPDVYGRLLAHVFVDGKSLSLLLVQNEHAYETVSIWGSNGFYELGRQIRDAARSTSPDFQEPRIWRARHTIR